MKKNVAIGIVAHVDAGKTTLTEAMLFEAGNLRRLGRVDHRDSYLDNSTVERERGITVFSKQAVVSLSETELIVIDTPGHADFTCETERAMWVMDYALLVISGLDGVQAHTETIWKMLKRFSLPCFIFISKMDVQCADSKKIFQQLMERLSENCVDFSDEKDLDERIAVCDDEATEEYLDNMKLKEATVSRLIKERKVFPCFFGSGLKNEGVQELLQALDRYSVVPNYGEAFSSKVYKIGRDSKGTRLTYLKITGGGLSAKQTVDTVMSDGSVVAEKVNEIRIYSGQAFSQVAAAFPGQICAVTGLMNTAAGQGLGEEPDAPDYYYEPVMAYSLIFPDGEDPKLMYPLVLQLSEEDPQLHVVWDSIGQRIELRIMGKVQAEVLVRILEERLGINARFDSGRIMYRETISDKVEGVGHFEPLRHYAEVHLVMEPLPEGSGIVLNSICSEDVLDRNWQRLILSHLTEKTHIGVLTGSPITDMKITLAAGKAHVKHTEGGDFRQATYRAVRQGLMKAKNVLLEPYYSFAITVPTENIGRVISDVKMMRGEFSGPESRGDCSTIQGVAPVALMNAYPDELVSFTHGKGKISIQPSGYKPCFNQKEVVEKLAYNPLADTENTPDSVFCSHGAGVNVSWEKVEEHMHLESSLARDGKQTGRNESSKAVKNVGDRELEAIMEREFGPIHRPRYSEPIRNEARLSSALTDAHREKYYILDGYNVIYSWDVFKKYINDGLDLARNMLVETVVNYSSFIGAHAVVVFDGYRTPGNTGSQRRIHDVSVVYTAEGETADSFIEKLVCDVGPSYAVTVVTGDNLIKVSALRAGVLNIHPSDFEDEVRDAFSRMEELIQKTNMMPHTKRIENGKE